MAIQSFYVSSSQFQFFVCFVSNLSISPIKLIGINVFIIFPFYILNVQRISTESSTFIILYWPLEFCLFLFLYYSNQRFINFNILKNRLLALLIFPDVCQISISFISAFIFIISCLFFSFGFTLLFSLSSQVKILILDILSLFFYFSHESYKFHSKHGFAASHTF